ncbi:MAG: NAD(P)H-dependent oxidoreductase subunit E [Kiritimatiellae bacterium]|nr:NAD(P)H-dependent oxidoreductase subunit E [Kiritimatiellia bacterium]MBP9572776.1 NAD(P)H-dependent oxidoreductase subunit E [Kiritimatiellia bacterium]
MAKPETCAGCAAAAAHDEAELLARLDEALAMQRDKPGGLIPALQMAQAIFGYLPEVALRRVAAAFDKSYSEVTGVVSFYSFFSTVPRGRYLVRVCLGTACYVRGGSEVLRALQAKLGIGVGETTPDHLFSLEVGRCFGACGMAPVLMINDDLHPRVKPAKLGELLESYRARAQGAETEPS